MVVTHNVFLDMRRDRADQIYLLKIRVTVNRKSKEISLNTYLNKNDWDAKHDRVKPAHPNAKLITQKLTTALNKLQEIALRLEAQDKVFSVEDIVDTYLNKKDFRPTVVEFGKAIIEEMKFAGRVGNARVYKDAVYKLQHYLNGKTLYFEQMDCAYLIRWSNSMLAEKVSVNCIANYMSQIRALFNRAIKEGVVEQKYYPFNSFRIKREPTISRALTVAEMTHIASLEVELNSPAWHNRNYFLLSFCFIGISFADLLSLRGENVIGDRLVYKRKKTKKLYTIKIHPPALRILRYYHDESRQDKSDYLLPVLPKEEKDPTKLMKLTLQAIKTCNKYIGRIGYGCGIKAKVTTYYARYAFANIARSLGVSKDVIAQALGHEYGNRVTGIYLDNYDKEIIDEANAKVIAAVFD
jgi:integrase/recombinase XerD